MFASHDTCTTLDWRAARALRGAAGGAVSKFQSQRSRFDSPDQLPLSSTVRIEK